jgi:hypothetical protein
MAHRDRTWHLDNPGRFAAGGLTGSGQLQGQPVLLPTEALQGLLLADPLAGKSEKIE